MTNPLKTLLEFLATRPTGQATSASIIDLFSAESIHHLKKAAILQDGETNKTVLCTSCDVEHQTEWKKLPDGRFLAFCERGGGPQIVSKDQVTTSQVDTKTFLSSFAAALGAETDIKPLAADELWEIGLITVAKRKQKALFLRTNTSQRHIELINALSRTVPIIVFSIHPPAFGAAEETVFFDPTLFTSLKATGLVTDIKKLEASIQTLTKQRVTLRPNGDLNLDGVTICNIPIHKAEFLFVQRLIEEYGFPVSHEKIYTHCKNGSEITTNEVVMQRFCNNCRSAIKKLARERGNETIVDQIIVPAKTEIGENAYKIQNPLEKVARR
jgi:hypothetical protein